MDILNALILSFIYIYIYIYELGKKVAFSLYLTLLQPEPELCLKPQPSNVEATTCTQISLVQTACKQYLLGLGSPQLCFTRHQNAMSSGLVWLLARTDSSCLPI
jgi:hypothetical protein